MGKEKNEAVCWVVRPTMRAYLKAPIMLFLLFCIPLFFYKGEYLEVYIVGAVSLVFFIILPLSLIAALIDKISYKFTLNDNEVIAQNGILSKNIDLIKIEHVRSINLRQTFFKRIFRFGDLYLGTSGTDGLEIYIKNIPEPQKFKNLIQERMALQKKS